MKNIVNTISFSAEKESIENACNCLVSTCRKSHSCGSLCPLFTQCSNYLQEGVRLDEFALNMRGGLIHGDKMPVKELLDIEEIVKEVDDILSDVLDLECLVKVDIEIEYVSEIKEKLSRLKDKMKRYELF